MIKCCLSFENYFLGGIYNNFLAFTELPS